MSRNKKFLIGFAAAMMALFAGIYAGQRQAHLQQETRSLLAVATLDGLFSSTLSDTDGKSQAFSQWRGKILVVNFWAAWCPPCIEEMPGFSRLQTKYAANGVQFVGIALDSPKNVLAFAHQFPATYPLLIGGAEGADLARQLGNARLALPYTAIISSAGEVRFSRLGGLAEPDLDGLLQQVTSR